MIKLRRRSVVVNLATGRVFAGELLLGTPWSYRLRQATMPESDGRGRPVDGVLVIPRRQVEFIQIVD